MLFDPTRSVFEYSLTMAVFSLVFVLASLLSLWRPRFKRVGRIAATFAVIVVAGQGLLFFPSVAKIVSAISEIDQPISTEQLERAQAIVIIGGGVEWLYAV